MRPLRVFISGVMATHELDEDRIEARDTVDAFGEPFSAFAYEKLPPFILDHDVWDNVWKSDVLLLLVARRMTPVVQEEFENAGILGLPRFVLARTGEKQETGLSEFLTNCGDPVHSYYRSPSSLTHLVRSILHSLGEWDSPAQVVLSHTADIWTRLISDLARDPDLVFSLSPRKFEELLAELMASYGYAVTLTPATQDVGYDILARRLSDPLFPDRRIIEAKLWRPPRKVGRPVIQAVYGTGISEECNGIMVVSPSGFSRQAITWAGRHSLRNFVRLLDNAHLAALYRHYLTKRRVRKGP